MPDEITTPIGTTPDAGLTASARVKTLLSNKKVIAMLAAGVVVVVGGITGTAIGVTNYAAATERLCAVALTGSTRAATDARTAISAADETLVAAAVLELPDGAGTSSDYAAHAAVEAVSAVEEVTAVDAIAAVVAVAASEGIEGIDAVDEVEAVAAVTASDEGCFLANVATPEF